MSSKLEARRDTLTETYDSQEHDLIRRMSTVVIKNLDNNTSQPVQLSPPTKHAETKRKYTTSMPTLADPPTHEILPRFKAATQSGTSKAGKRNSAGHTTNKHLTLQFSDPLAQPQGSKDATHEYVAIDADEGKKSGSASPTTGMQKGLEAWKRMSSGWSTPLRSPGLMGPSPINESNEIGVASRPGGSSPGYFD